MIPAELTFVTWHDLWIPYLYEIGGAWNRCDMGQSDRMDRIDIGLPLKQQRCLSLESVNMLSCDMNQPRSGSSQTSSNFQNSIWAPGGCSICRYLLTIPRDTRIGNVFKHVKRARSDWSKQYMSFKQRDKPICITDADWSYQNELILHSDLDRLFCTLYRSCKKMQLAAESFDEASHPMDMEPTLPPASISVVNQFKWFAIYFGKTY